MLELAPFAEASGLLEQTRMRSGNAELYVNVNDDMITGAFPFLHAQ